ncbi:MAG: hypothetical protein ACLQKA_23715 [Bryobacteraceae bacterium]
MRLIYVLLPLTLLVAAGGAAETGPDPRAALVVSASPMVLDYSFFARYASQSIGDDDHYSRIEAYIGLGGKDGPTRVVLTGKPAGKSVSYVSGSDAIDASASGTGPVIETPIAVNVPEALTQNTPIEIALRDQNGLPLRWRFVCAYPSSPDGSGLAPLPAVGGLMLQYRDLGTVAGPGSVVELGNRLSYAEVWREISSPPFFVPYRGYYGEGFHVARFLLQDHKWRIVGSVNSLAEGSHWEFVAPDNARRAFTVSQHGQTTVVSTGTEPHGAILSAVLDAAAGPPCIRSLEAAQGSHRMVVLFHPALVLTAPTSVDFQVEVDKKKVAQGSLTVAEIDGGNDLIWRFKSPDWAKARVLHETIRASQDGVSLQVSQ